MENTFLIAAIAGAGAIVGFWHQIKALFERIISYFVVSMTIESGYSYSAATYYCFNCLKRSPIGPRVYGAHKNFVKPTKRQQVIGFEKVGTSVCLFWLGWRPIWVTVLDKEAYNNKVKMSFLRGTFNSDKLMIDMIDRYNSASAMGMQRFKITYIFGSGPDGGEVKHQTFGEKDGYVFSHRYLKWRQEDVGEVQPLEGSSFEALAVPDEVAKSFAEAKFWKNSEKWFRKHQIPWKRGWLIHGQPGTGKTSLARAVAQELDLPVFIFDLATLSNKELRDEWNGMLLSVPCMAVFEDIDNVFKGRENISSKDKLKGGLSFDCVLNCMDGIQRTDGLFTIITTNKTDHIDAALAEFKQDGTVSTRPGRIDRVIELNSPARSGLEKICRRILNSYPKLQQSTIELGLKERDTAAQFQERCSRIAITEHFKKPIPCDPDETDRRRIITEQRGKNEHLQVR